MSAGEIGIILIVGLVIVGPKKLPEMMRSLGKWVAKLRRLSTTLRDQSGIDRILKEEGLDKEIRELRALRESLSKSAVLESLMQAANKPASSPVRPAVAKSLGPKPATSSATEPAKTPDPGPPGASTPPVPEKPASSSEDAAKAEAAHKEEAAKATDAATAGATQDEPNKVAVGSDGSATTSSALGLVQPAVGSIPRGGTATPAAPLPVVYEPLASFREREYPAFGPDHYDAFPDDLADDEEMVEPGKIGESSGVVVTQPETAR